VDQPAAATRTREALRGLALLGMLGLAGACRHQTPAPAQIEPQARAEVARLQRVLGAKPAQDPVWRDARPRLEAGLAQAREALAAGRLYLGLEELGQVRSSLRGLETAVEARRAAQGGLPGFTLVWMKTSAELSARDREARGRAWTGTPLAIRALAETAEGQTMPLLAASRAYAGVTSPGAGFYYLGEAKAAAEQAEFCHALRNPRPVAPFPLRSLLAELRGLQERTTAAFRPPRSIRLHGRFIRLNATLKLAFELDAARLYAGAMYQYLDAAEQLDLLDPAAVPAAEAISQEGAPRPGLPGAIAAMRSRLSRLPQDGSLAELFLERAEAVVDPRRGAAPSLEAQRTAAAIVERVLPLYFAALQPAAPRPQVTGKPLTVTLLRWPYT
jgi:hypothetical protein